MTDVTAEATEESDLEAEVAGMEGSETEPDEAPEGEEGEGVGDGEEGDDTDIEANPDDEPLEEIERDGKKYKIPAKLKPELMMQADYTRKTQEVAQLRKEAEEAKAVAISANSEHMKGMAQLVAIESRLEEFDQVDWDALQAQDEAQANALWRQRTLLTEARGRLQSDLQAKEQARALETQAQSAKAVEEGRAVLARDIKGWGPDLAGKLSEYAEKEFGVSRQEMAQIVDPRIVKVLHRAFQNDQSNKSQKAAEIVKRTEAVRPTPSVGRSGGVSTKDPNKMSFSEFEKFAQPLMRRR